MPLLTVLSQIPLSSPLSTLPRSPETEIFKSQPLGCWGYRHVPLCLIWRLFDYMVSIFIFLKVSSSLQTGKMAQWLRAHGTFAEDLGFSFSSEIGQHLVP